MTESPIATYLNWIQENGGTHKKIEFRNGIELEILYLKTTRFANLFFILFYFFILK